MTNTNYAQIAEAEEAGKKAFHQFQSYLEEKLGSVRTEVEALKTSSALTGEDKQNIERLQGTVMDVKKQLETLQVAMNAPGFGTSPEQKKNVVATERKTAFNKLLRAGSVNALSAEERKHIKWDADENIETKALYTADLTGGGFLTVPEYVDDLIKNIVLISDMISLVDVRITSKPWVMTPKRTQTASAQRVAEQATRTETQNPRFGLMQNFPYEAYAFTLVSRTDMDDSELDLSSFIMSEFAEQFAKLQGNEYINGLGSAASQALGFLNDATINNGGSGTVTTAASGLLDYASLVKIKMALKPGYLPNATWVATNETWGSVQQLTDLQGRPLWIPFGGSMMDSFFGRPWKIMPDMPQMAANGGSSGALAMAFGDFKAGYQAVIRKQVSMQVLNERYADQNAVGFFGYYRFGGTTKVAEAIKTLKVHV